MCADVRVHVRLGSTQLDYTGDQSFYEKHVEALVDAAANGGPRSVARVAPTRIVESVAVVSATSASSAAASAAPAAVARTFAPQSGEFGRFLKRIQREAQAPDQQVVAIAFYLWLYEKRETFGVGELTGCYRAVGLPLPDGVDSILADLSERKRFVEPAGDSQWRLTRKGENYVKTRLLAGPA